MENEILKIAKSIQAISQTGIRFTKDNFDKQRFEELRELSVRLVAQIADSNIEKIRDLFTCETGFQTPKIDIRAVVVEKGRLLLTKENSDNKWSLPGGYADINYSPSEIAEKEVFEETGLKVKTNRILAIIDTNKHSFPPLEYHFYKIVILCDLIEGELRGSDETEESDFFDFNNLPELSLKRNTYELIDLIKQGIEHRETYID
ncbi:NUDIX domain-containing protein [Marinilabiliaceae bacterium JC017]|nr:NUDIX domain-containing protein [Marinilabiliaceae bacterium JC017]